MGDEFSRDWGEVDGEVSGTWEGRTKGNLWSECKLNEEKSDLNKIK